MSFGDQPLHSLNGQGDYLTDDYAYLWERDIPILANMGANTLYLPSFAFNQVWHCVACVYVCVVACCVCGDVLCWSHAGFVAFRRFFVVALR